MNIRALKEQAVLDMNGGELGFAEAVVGGRLTLVTAKKYGGNKPGRNDHIRFTVTDKGEAQ